MRPLYRNSLHDPSGRRDDNGKDSGLTGKHVPHKPGVLPLLLAFQEQKFN